MEHPNGFRVLRILRELVLAIPCDGGANALGFANATLTWLLGNFDFAFSLHVMTSSGTDARIGRRPTLEKNPSLFVGLRAQEGRDVKSIRARLKAQLEGTVQAPRVEQQLKQKGVRATSDATDSDSDEPETQDENSNGDGDHVSDSETSAATARQGVELADGWVQFVDSASGKFYYFNNSLGITTWDLEKCKKGLLALQQNESDGDGEATAMLKPDTQGDQLNTPESPQLIKQAEPVHDGSSVDGHSSPQPEPSSSHVVCLSIDAGIPFEALRESSVMMVTSIKNTQLSVVPAATYLSNQNAASPIPLVLGHCAAMHADNKSRARQLDPALHPEWNFRVFCDDPRSGVFFSAGTGPGLVAAVKWFVEMLNEHHDGKLSFQHIDHADSVVAQINEEEEEEDEEDEEDSHEDAASTTAANNDKVHVAPEKSPGTTRETATTQKPTVTRALNFAFRIPARSHQTQRVEVATSGATISWRLHVHKHDIKWEIRFHHSVGKKSSAVRVDDNHSSVVIVPMAKIAASDGQIRGEYIAGSPGVVSFKFENSYSLLRMKKVFMDVTVEDDSNWEYDPDVATAAEGQRSQARIGSRASRTSSRSSFDSTISTSDVDLSQERGCNQSAATLQHTGIGAGAPSASNTSSVHPNSSPVTRSPPRHMSGSGIGAVVHYEVDSGSGIGVGVQESPSDNAEAALQTPEDDEAPLVYEVAGLSGYGAQDVLLEQVMEKFGSESGVWTNRHFKVICLSLFVSHRLNSVTVGLISCSLSLQLTTAELIYSQAFPLYMVRLKQNSPLAVCLWEPTSFACLEFLRESCSV